MKEKIRNCVQDNWFKAIIALVILLIGFSAGAGSAGAYISHDCSQYGTQSYYDSSVGACKCMYGYVFGKNFLGDTYCISYSQRCQDLYGSMVTSDLSGNCKCMSGYVFSKDYSGNTTCMSGTQVCQKQYGSMVQYNSLTDKCECVSGYLLRTDSGGNTTCVSNNSLCNEYGLMARYNSLSGKCECYVGYIFVTDSFGKTTCVYKLTYKNSLCVEQFGSMVRYNNSTDKCECMDGYVFNTDSLGNTKCISLDQWCKEKNGQFSNYDDSSDKCVCQSGYEFTLKGNNGLECVSCYSKYGVHSQYDYVNKKCACKDGYILDEKNQCVEKQNNVYFFLKEINTDDKKAIIKSEYDYKYYLITYGYGCNALTIKKYLNNKIIINLGTDFYVDKGDRVVLFNDNEVCDIMTVESVSPDCTLVKEKDGDFNASMITVINNYTNTDGGIPEGALIRAKGDIDVYIVKYVGSKKFKRLILSPSVFNNYGHLKWGDIKDIDKSIVDSFITSDLVKAVGDSKVYKLYPSGDTGQKRWIKTASVFESMGFDFDSIYEINSFDRDSYITGSVIE